MSRIYSSYIPAEQVENATEWAFSAVDEAALRFAAKLRAQELEEARARDDTARKAGYAEGYAAGFAQGHAKATLEGQKLIADYIANQGQESAERLGALISSAHSQLLENEQTLAQGVLELAGEIARQVLRREFTTNPNVLQPVVREALALLTLDHKAAAVRLHPRDMDVLADDLQKSCPNLALTLVPDNTLTPGGCLVETSGSVIDGTVERRWSRAVAALGLESAWEQAGDPDDTI